MRIIARLDIKSENLIKGIQFEGLRVIGNPNEYALKYYNDNADEILLIDTVASLYNRNNIVEIINKASENIFVPITAGGGIREIKDVERLLKNGADKVFVNTGAVKNPKLITDLVKEFGSQSIVSSIEAKKISEKKWEVYTENGREKTNLDLENPLPLGGPINEPFQTIIGSEVKSFNTTQPFTPKNTYKDSLQSAELRARASDPIR